MSWYPLAAWIAVHGHDGSTDYMRDADGWLLPHVNCPNCGASCDRRPECRHGLDALVEAAHEAQKPDLFAAETGDHKYVAVRNNPNMRDVRAAMESAWDRVWRLCPEGAKQFTRLLPMSFEPRTWELFLMGALDAAGLELLPPPRKGPDICIKLESGVRCWIEARAPGPGETPDAPFQRPPGPWRGALYPEPQLLLRYTSALEDKFKKLSEYRADGIIKPDDAVVIAVYQGGVLDSDLHDDSMPSIAKALFGLGDEVLVCAVGDTKPPVAEILKRSHLVTHAGQKVSTEFFLEPRTDFISAVVCAPTFLITPWSAAASLCVIHRPDALVPLPHGDIPAKCEMWGDAEKVLRHRGRCARFGVYSQDSS